MKKLFAIIIILFNTSIFAMPPCGTSFLSILYDCHGTQKDKNGNWYRGEFRNGKFNGSGIIEFANGDRFEGEFKENFVFKGTIYYANGDTYEGEWANQTFNGQGVYAYTKENVRSYVVTSVGEWKNGMPHGRHVQYDGNNCIIRSGIFESGTLKIFDSIDLKSFDKIKLTHIGGCQ